jgi:hypothetical protein
VATAGSVAIPVVPDFSAFPEVARLELRPGDRLVLSYAACLTDEQVGRLHDEVEAWWLPEGVQVIILDGGASLQVLAREDPP